MGVPKFFRWITDRYPAVLSKTLKEGEENAPVDNLYLDMNGIIHECCYSKSPDAPPLSFEEAMENIFAEINRIMNLVRPKVILYVAVDGVAPRAKLNQQRARRFKSAKERLTQKTSQHARNDENVDASRVIPAFDSNSITPGTEFMSKLSVVLRSFIQQMLRSNPLWSHLHVHFTGSEVPGEGEHKIISFIREQRQRSGHNPNTRHCILGADADMLMLSLATHEPYFLVLRDMPRFGGNGHSNHQNENTRSSTETQGNRNNDIQQQNSSKIMKFVRINILREYIVKELLEGQENPTQFDAERLIDDFVFLTFLVGNDFLPHLPALNIGDSAFDFIFDAYKTVLGSAAADGDLDYDYEEPSTTAGTSSTDPYLVRPGGELDLTKLELIFALLGVTEKTLFAELQLSAVRKAEVARDKRAAAAEHRRRRMEAQQLQVAVGEGQAVMIPLDATSTTFEETTNNTEAEKEAQGSAMDSSSDSDREEEEVGKDTTLRAAAETAASSSSSPLPITTTTTSEDAATLLNLDPVLAAGCLLPEDPLDREEHFKARYYQEKFGLEDVSKGEGRERLRRVVEAYTEGLQWCLQYYMCGCQDWNWYYPYHYGPFLHDMTQLEEAVQATEWRKAQATKKVNGSSSSSSSKATTAAVRRTSQRQPLPNQPLQPFQQLLACLPAASSALLPACYRSLMTSDTSPLRAFYPLDFSTDLNGKKQEYEAVVLLPFLNIELLLEHEERARMGEMGGPPLTETEIARNQHGVGYLYFMREVGSSTADRHLFLDAVELPRGPAVPPRSDAFQARLLPGTLSLDGTGYSVVPGFPSMREMLDYYAFHGGGGGSWAQQKQQKIWNHQRKGQQTVRQTDEAGDGTTISFAELTGEAAAPTGQNSGNNSRRNNSTGGVRGAHGSNPQGGNKKSNWKNKNRTNCFAGAAAAAGTETAFPMPGAVQAPSVVQWSETNRQQHEEVECRLMLRLDATTENYLHMIAAQVVAQSGGAFVPSSSSTSSPSQGTNNPTTAVTTPLAILSAPFTLPSLDIARLLAKRLRHQIGEHYYQGSNSTGTPVCKLTSTVTTELTIYGSVRVRVGLDTSTDDSRAGWERLQRAIQSAVRDTQHKLTTSSDGAQASLAARVGPVSISTSDAVLFGTYNETTAGALSGFSSWLTNQLQTITPLLPAGHPVELELLVRDQSSTSTFGSPYCHVKLVCS